MRIRRGLLFWGLFLIPLGGISLLVRAGVIDAGQLAEAWRLWPLILVGVGLAIILGRSRTAVLGTAIIALVLGSLGGAALAGGNLFEALSDCTNANGPTDQHLQRSGTLDPTAAVDLDLKCGTVTIGTAPGTGWTVDAAYRGAQPIVDASPGRLAVRTPGGGTDRRNDWKVGLPASVGVLSFSANAASGTLAFPDGHVSRLNAELNAGDLRVDTTRGAIDDVDLSLNAGRIRLDAGTSSLDGEVSVNAGAFDLCVPDGVGLRLEVTNQLTFVHNLASRGLSRSDDTWTRSATAGGATISLSVGGAAASFSLNPEGGCR